MRKNKEISNLDLAQRWAEITGSDFKTVKHRTNAMRLAGLLPSDTRCSNARLTVGHVASFILGILSSDETKSAPQAAVARGSLTRSKIVTKGDVTLWSATGTLQNDLQYLLVESRDRMTDWTTAMIEVSTTHPHALLTLFHMRAQCTVCIHYGELPLTLGSLHPVRRTNMLEGSVFRHMAQILSDYEVREAA